MGLLDTLKDLLGMRDTVDANRDNEMDAKDTASGFEQFSDTDKDQPVDMTGASDWSDTTDTNKDTKLSVDDIGATLDEKTDRK